MERALQHIEDAKRLSHELGGTDKDVKDYFFSLSKPQLDLILKEYGQIHGSSPKSYAENAIPKWRSGEVKMSGTVAERLFKLLPPRMPIKKKYELVESLWRNLGPKSQKTYTVGYDTSIDQIITEVSNHADKVIEDFAIPENIENRFKWLSAGDVNVRQELLNHLQKFERLSVLNGAREHVPTIIEHLNSPDGEATKSATQELKVGNHSIRLEFEKSHSGISEGSIRKHQNKPSSSSDDSVFGWVILLIVGAGILYFLFAQ
ncbi:hypothetical protein [Falsihalocynthiibacter sp. CO-5D18]|uniref:hypothetical protein n=1 Tax=Falsihalocynthiibacter sp. CO-5D18 TaxID=3240872 RepID=UPI00350F9EE3